MNFDAFRVYDREEKRWLEPVDTRIEGRGYLYVKGSVLSKKDDPYQIDEWYHCDGDRFTICSYTGRDDEDGEAIFENDRVGSGEFEGVVRWSNRFSAWRVFGDDGSEWALVDGYDHLGSALEIE